MNQWIFFKELLLVSQVCQIVSLHWAWLSNLVDIKSNRRRQPGQDATHFKTDEDTGKMIIDGDMDSDAEERAPQNAATDVAGTAYRESITSVDGFTRGPNGRIKFNKDTKKRRRDEDANQDVEMADLDELASGKRSKKPKKKADPKFGHEFKAKVCTNIRSSVINT